MNRKIFICGILILTLSTLFATQCKRPDQSKEIRLGALFDLTGPTSESGNQYAEGVKGYVDYINELGGINGRKIVLIIVDTAYVTQRDIDAYEKLVKVNKVHLIIGWSTAGALALVPKVAKDEIPFTSVSYSKSIANPETAPYNFLVGPTYSDQMIITLKYVLTQWKDKTVKPKVAFLYNGTEFGKSPIADGKAFAEKNGIEIVAEEIVNLDAREASEQLKKVQEKNADYAVINETAWATSVILKDAKKMGLKTKFMGLIYSADEKVVALAGMDAEGYIGIFPHLFSEKDASGIKKIAEFNKNKGVAAKTLALRYINGWVTTQMMLEGARRAGDYLNGEDIKKSLESIQNFDTGGITSPFTFTPTDHVGFKKARLAQVVNGKWQVMTGYLSAD